MNLFATVYQHPKVRAAEMMFQAVIEAAKNDPERICFQVSGRALDLNRATDYLWLTDEVFFSEALRRNREDPLHRMLHDIRFRRFFVRALTISNDTVDPQCQEAFLQLRKLNQPGVWTHEAKRSLAKEILTASGLEDQIGIGQIWVDLPGDPSFGEAERTLVRTETGALRKIGDLFAVHYWSELYRKHKWRGHVFCPLEYQQRVHEAALEVFKGHGITFKRSAGETAHVAHPRSSG
jgi:HD superfamily phosphohydrolase